MAIDSSSTASTESPPPLPDRLRFSGVTCSHHMAAHRRGRGVGVCIASTASLAALFFSVCSVANAEYHESASLETQEEDAGQSVQCQPLTKLFGQFDNSWINHLSPETPANRARSQHITDAEDDGVSNNVHRPVYNGHYVLAKPTPLKNPRLVIYSPGVANILGLSDDDVSSTAFLKFFSGDVDVEATFDGKSASDDAKGIPSNLSWATPYALSIMGRRYTSNCPFKTGDGYGDGRAISVGEIAVPEERAERPAAARYELQLKGSGPTPFCRGADGRAVLRSSVREFLASEAMAALGVSTTRALSLIVSDGPDGDTVDRPWYSDGSVRRAAPELNDPRLARYSLEQRRRILADWTLMSRSDPDVMIEEPCAITTRVSPSFVRVGHFDLYARRVVGIREPSDGDGNEGYDTTTNEWKELEQMLWHACFREYPGECFEPHRDANAVSSAAKCLLEKSMDDLSTMTANWIRVGFAQGNFNADNCLVAGRTMDYGPFGFMDEYHPLFAKWTGSGDHFGFMNQPQAGYANFQVLVESVMPLIEAHDGTKSGKQFHTSVLREAKESFDEKVAVVFRTKLGFHPSDASADKLWEALDPLLRVSRADWTLFWRQLYLTLKDFPVLPGRETSSVDYGSILDHFLADDKVREASSPFYEPLDKQKRKEFLDWIIMWRTALVSIGAQQPDRLDQNKLYDQIEDRMRRANPKYILREWMLVEAYTKASPPVFKLSEFPAAVDPGDGDDSSIHELLELVQRPYDEGTYEQDQKYYRRAPDQALNAGGTAFMS